MSTPRLAAACLCLSLLACEGEGARGAAAPTPAGPPREVRVAAVTTAVWPRVVRVTGELLPAEAVVARAEVAGRLTEVAVDLGDRVGAGQVLARVDEGPLRLELERARAALVEARTRLGLPPLEAEGEPAGAGPSDEAALDAEADARVRIARARLAEAERRQARIAQMRAQGVATAADDEAVQSELEVAREQVRQALDGFESDRAAVAVRRAELALARDRLERAVLRAPFAGRVAARRLGPGERVEVGAAVIELARIDPLRLRIDVPELDASGLRVGNPLRATVDGFPTALEATLARLSPAIDPAARTRRAEADVPNPDGALPGGAFARVDLVVAPQAEALVLPAAAVRTFAGIDQLLLVEADGKVREVPVTLGRRDAERVEVLDAELAGARAVLDPGGLQGGAAVRVLE